MKNENIDLEYEQAKKSLFTDWLKFFENNELQTMLVVIVILFLLRVTDVMTVEGFERGILTAIISGFGADGLNKLTNMNRGD